MHFAEKLDSSPIASASNLIERLRGHQCHIMMDEFVKPLWPVKPIITSFELSPQQTQIVPRIHRQSRKEETTTTRFGSPNRGTNPIAITVVLQGVFEITHEVDVFLRQSKWIGKGFD